MRIRIATLTICALLGGGACAEDQAPPASDARHPGSDRTGIPSGNAFSASQVDEPIHIESTANIPSSDLLVYGPSNIKWGATELLVIRKFSGSSGDTSSNFLTIDLLFPSALADNQTYGPLNLISWSITDGTHTLSSADGNYLDGGSVSTNAGGIPLFWSLSFFTSGPPDTDPELQSHNIPGVGTSDSYVLDSNDVASIGTAGTWTGAPAPEPGTIVFMISGGILVALIAQRRRVLI